MLQKSFVQTFLRAIFLVCFGGFFSLYEYETLKFDFFVFTQQWPQAICININETKPELGCVMPPNVKNWTIHGLWPSKCDGEGPYFCNSSWPFREADIESLRVEMDKHWPNLIGHTEHTSFWKHEWMKHGTCAATLPKLNSELKYFNTCLTLRNVYDLTRIFAKDKIFPSNKQPYSLLQIRNALEAFTKTHTRILCLVSKDRSNQLLVQIEICIDKNYKEIDCTKQLKQIPYNPDFEVCSSNMPIFYLPIGNK